METTSPVTFVVGSFVRFKISDVLLRKSWWTIGIVQRVIDNSSPFCNNILVECTDPRRPPWAPYEYWLSSFDDKRIELLTESDYRMYLSQYST